MIINKLAKDIAVVALYKLALLETSPNNQSGIDKTAEILWADGIFEKEFAKYGPEQKTLLAKALRKGEVLPIVKGYRKIGWKDRRRI